MGERAKETRMRRLAAAGIAFGTLGGFVIAPGVSVAIDAFSGGQQNFDFEEQPSRSDSTVPVVKGLDRLPGYEAK